MITQSINQATPINSVTAVNPPPTAQNSNSSQLNSSGVVIQDPLIDRLTETITPNYLSKAIQLYMLLREISDIDINENRIKVGSERLFGLPVTNIGQLIKPNKYLSFNLTPLLKEIRNEGEIVKLISNKQAKEQLKALAQASSLPKPQKSSTPRKKADKSSESTLRGETEFFDPDFSLEDSKFGSGPKIKKKRILWKTLF